MPITIKANGKFVGTWPSTIKEVRINSANSTFKFTLSNNISTVDINTPIIVTPPTVDPYQDPLYYTPRTNKRYVSIWGNNNNDGSKTSPWRDVQTQLIKGNIPNDVEIRFMGSQYYIPGYVYNIFESFGSVIIPEKVTFTSDDGYRACMLDGRNVNGNAFSFWYPPQTTRDIEIQGLQFRNWSLSTRAGGVSPITLGGDIENIRILGNTFKDNGFVAGALDHDIYIAGGLAYTTAARNIMIRHNDFEDTVNQDYRIKIGSGGPGTAGPYGNQTAGAASHGVKIRKNTFRGKGWGALLVVSEYTLGNPANSEFVDNNVSVDNSNLKNWDGSDCTSNYGGPVYFTWAQGRLTGCDSTFIVSDNFIEVLKTDQSNWHALYIISIHSPTVNNNVLRNISIPQNTLGGR